MKKALITGITGQDGSYLAELLLSKDYQIHGLIRQASTCNTSRIDHLIKNNNFHLHYGDITDSCSIIKLVQEIEPDEIYNLAAQSHVKVSWDCPEYTANTDGLGALRLLEAIRVNKLEQKTRYYQASTSELYGLTAEKIQNEKTPFYPRSPYAVSKLFAYWICVNYRESFGIFASNGILFNHESPRRGETFVTRKITKAATRIKLGLQNKLYLGNLSAKRDWGHAKDYVDGMFKIMQNKTPDDFVLATGKTASVRDFCKMAFEEVGISLDFQGEGLEEKGIDTSSGKILVEVSPQFFRPLEVDFLLGDYSKAKNILNWEPKYDLKSLIKEMVENDLLLAKQEKLLAETCL